MNIIKAMIQQDERKFRNSKADGISVRHTGYDPNRTPSCQCAPGFPPWQASRPKQGATKSLNHKPEEATCPWISPLKTLATRRLPRSNRIMDDSCSFFLSTPSSSEAQNVERQRENCFKFRRCRDERRELETRVTKYVYPNTRQKMSPIICVSPFPGAPIRQSDPTCKIHV